MRFGFVKLLGKSTKNGHKSASDIVSEKYKCLLSYDIPVVVMIGLKSSQNAAKFMAGLLIVFTWAI